ncbi:MAG TPA: hypothetical protein VHR55_04725 [Candidatus Limnocylindria bacterium]|nr:hypothetical protein [Candidatus Limnocylindria bacterium]
MHRVRQFASHVRARVGDEETALAHRILPAGAVALFDRMPVADRRHALDVVRRLLAAGHDDPDLLTAALLHDAAKGHRMRLWHRVAGVLLEGLAPALLRWLASEDPRSWRHPFHLYLHHAGLSADLALAAGASERAAAFIRGAPAAGDVHLGRALEAADDAS